MAYWDEFQIADGSGAAIRSTGPVLSDEEYRRLYPEMYDEQGTMRPYQPTQGSGSFRDAMPTLGGGGQVRPADSGPMRQPLAQRTQPGMRIPAPRTNPDGSPLATTMPVPNTPQPGGMPQAPNGNLMDPAYIDQWIQAANAERIKNGGQPLDPEEWRRYITTPDTMTGGEIHQGPNAYWWDRATNPNSMGASSVAPGDATRIGMDTGGPTGGAPGAGGQAFLDSYFGQGYGKEFAPTSIQNILGSEAFQAANQEGLNSISRMKSASGDLHSGGTLKDLAKYTNSLALGAVNDQFNRDASTFDLNRGTFWGDRDRGFSRLSDFTRLGQSGAGQLGGYGSGYAGNATDLTTGMGNAQAGAAAARPRGAFGSTLGAMAQADWSKILKKPATV